MHPCMLNDHCVKEHMISESRSSYYRLTRHDPPFSIGENLPKDEKLRQTPRPQV